MLRSPTLWLSVILSTHCAGPGTLSPDGPLDPLVESGMYGEALSQADDESTAGQGQIYKPTWAPVITIGESSSRQAGTGPWQGEGTPATNSVNTSSNTSNLSLRGGMPGGNRRNSSNDQSEGRPPRGELTFHWPLPATAINSLYGERTDPVTGRSRFHYGIDLDGRYGQVVEAAAEGMVMFAGWNAGHGRMVIIEHGGGYRTSYSHLSQLTVSGHNWVKAGRAIGLLGNSGRSTGPHLHLEVTRYGSHVDPLEFLGSRIPID